MREIKEDNFVVQTILMNKKVNLYSGNLYRDFLGDAYFPRVNHYLFLDDLNLADYEGPDMALTEFIRNAITANNFSLIVSHFMGIDHASHYRGVLSDEMVQSITNS